MAPTHLQGRFGRPHHWRRKITVALFTLVVILFGAYLYLTRPARLAQLTGDLLTSLTGAQVDIGEARFSFDGAIHLSQVRLRVPGAPAKANQLFDVDQILVKHELLSLLLGHFQATSLTLLRPTLYNTEFVALDPNDKSLFNYELLRRDSSMTSPPGRLPEVFIREGAIVFATVEQGQYETRYRIDMEGTLIARDDDPGRYVFRLQETGAPGQEAANLSGGLRLRDMSVQITGGNVRVESTHVNLLPAQLRRWWETLEPQGTFTSIHFNWKDDVASAEWEIDQFALSLPYLGQRDQQGQPVADGRKFRMVDVSGRFEADGDHVKIHHLRGRIEGVAYNVSGDIFGLTRDAGFDITLETNRFALESEPSFLESLPQGVRRQFDKFKPSGAFQSKVVIQRQESGGPVHYDGTVNLTDGEITYEPFPYPIKNVNGEITFNEQVMTVTLLGDGVDGGRLDINGVIEPPGPNASFTFKIIADQLPLNESFLTYVPEKYHAPILMFADREQFQRLNELGLINSHADNQFQLGGVTHLDILAKREQGPDKPLAVDITIDMQGLGAMFVHWPYPVTLTGGRVRVEPNHVEVIDVRGQGPPRGPDQKRGQLAVSGRVDIPINPETGTRLAIPKLHITAGGAPVDELMLATVPEPQNQWLRDLELTGVLEANAEVFYDDQREKIDFEVTTHLTDGSVEPYQGRFRIDDLAGETIITSEGIDIRKLTGVWRDPSGDHISQIAFSGLAQLVDDAWRFKMDVDVKEMLFQSPLTDLIPPEEKRNAKQLADLLDKHQPRGLFDAHLFYDTAADIDKRYTLTVAPKQVDFQLRGQTIELSEMSGAMRLEPNVLYLNDLAGAFATGAFKVAGRVALSDPVSFDLRFDADSVYIDPTTRVVLPGVVLSTLEGLAIEGRYTLNEALLKYTAAHAPPNQPARGAVYDFDAMIHLSDARCDLGAPVTDLLGDLSVKVIKKATDDWAHVDLRLHADAMHVADRRVTNLDLQLASSPRRDRLELTEFRGDMYGGMLLGSGRVEMGEPNRFMFDLTLLDAALPPMLDPTESVVKPEAPARDKVNSPEGAFDRQRWLSQGRLSANLTIEALVGQPMTRSGRGMVQIRQADLYHVPLGLALLQLLNLSAPQAAAFDQADMRYVINGGKIVFDYISINAPTLEIYGDGVMQYDDLAIDLVMYSRNPARPDLGPINDIADAFRDQLICIVVDGTLDDPKTNVESFRGIRHSWRRIFNSNPPRRRQPIESQVGK